MFRQLIVVAGVLVFTNAISALQAQEQELPKQPPKYSDAKQPTTATAPPLKPKPPLEKPPRLTDGATDENGLPLVKEEGTTSVQAVELRRRDPDRVMATWIALANREEVILSNIASGRAASAEVRKFAKMVSEDHAALLQQLKPFAPEAIAPDYFNTTAKDARDNETTVRQRANDPDTTEKTGALLDEGPPAPTGRRPIETPEAVAAGRDFNVIQLERELAVQCLASNRKMLNERRGTDFDHFFLAQQIAHHNALRDKLIVYQRYVSTPLAEIFADAERVSDRHMEKALELIGTVPAKITTTTTRREVNRPAVVVEEK